MAYPSMNKSHMQDKYNVTKCSNRRTGKKVKYIVIHYTGTTVSAKNNCRYFGSGNRGASADYFIDTDGSIYKFNENCAGYYSWHCGGGKSYGAKNANSIGIEVVSKGAVFTVQQQASLQKLVTAIMADYGVSASNVIRHYDCNSIRKKCPAPYSGSTAKNKKWDALKSLITSTSSKTATATKTTAKTATTASKLTVDGVMGKNTIKALQKAVGAAVDGVKGKETIKALQHFLKKKGYSLTVDGIQGKNTNKALQKFLTKQGYKVTVDGVVGKKTIMALQKCLNAGKFK